MKMKTLNQDNQNTQINSEQNMLFGAAPTNLGVYGTLKDSNDIYFAKDKIYLPYSDGFFPNSTNKTYTFSTFNLSKASISDTTPTGTNILDLTVNTTTQKITLTPKNAGSCTILLTFSNGSTKTLTVYIEKTNSYFTQTANFYSGAYDDTLANIVQVKPVLNTGGTVDDNGVPHIYFMFQDISTKEVILIPTYYSALNNQKFNVGEYIGYYWGYSTDDNHINTTILSKKFKITQSEVQYVKEPTMLVTSFTYDGSTRSTVNAFTMKNSTSNTTNNNVSCKGATTQYVWGVNTSTKPTSGWTNVNGTIPLPSADAGQYYLWMRTVLASNTNYKIIDSQQAYYSGKNIGNVRINKSTVKFVTAPALTTTSAVYNGTSKSGMVNAYTMNNSTITTATNYKTTGAKTQVCWLNNSNTPNASDYKDVNDANSLNPSNYINAGSYNLWIKVVLDSANNYTTDTLTSSYLNGKKVGTFTINKAANPAKISQSSSATIYSNGSTTFRVTSIGNGTVTSWAISPNIASITYNNTSKTQITLSNWRVNQDTAFTLTVNITTSQNSNYNGGSITSSTYIVNYIPNTLEPTTGSYSEPTTAPSTTTTTTSSPSRTTSTTTQPATTTSSPTTSESTTTTPTPSKAKALNINVFLEEESTKSSQEDKTNSLSKVVDDYLEGRLN